VIVDDAFQEYLNHMPKDNDPLLLVLKGHLLIEQQLGGILAVAIPSVEYLELGKRKFIEKLRLCRSFARTQQASPAWELMLAINTLRNAYAHSLEPPDLQTKTDRVINLAMASHRSSFKQGDSSTTRLRIALLCPLSFLALLRLQLEEFQQRTEPEFPNIANAALDRFRSSGHWTLAIEDARSETL